MKSVNAKTFTGACARAVLVLLLTSQSSLLTHAAWTRQRIPSLAWLHSVFFLDTNHGWVAGSRGTLLTTDDGGAHWRALPRPTSDNIRDVHFSNSQNGVIVCERTLYDLKSNDEERAYLMKTNDGGERWHRLTIPGADANARLVRAIFDEQGFGWAFGEAGAIYTTNDSGANWTKLTAPTRSLLLGGDLIGNNAWLVGAGSTILQTFDGGETWQSPRLPTPEHVRLNGASFIEKRLGWIVGSEGAIYRTLNSGRSWQPQVSGVNTDLFDVKFLDAAEGWAVGANGVVIHTVDGGSHWALERALTDHHLERVFFSDRFHGWAVGFGGTIIAFTPIQPNQPHLN